MAKYTVVFSTLIVDGVKYRRGDVIETDKDLGTRVAPYVEPAPVVEEKPKATRKPRTVKAKASLEG
jgi:hypothetical protein